jgi:hypothetical protein
VPVPGVVKQGEHYAEEPFLKYGLQGECQMCDNNALGVIEDGGVPDEGWMRKEGVE